MKNSLKKLPALLLAGSLVLPGVVPIDACATEQTGTVIDVTEYGAEADNGKDNAQAIVKAVAAAKKASDRGEHVTISFPKGRYDIYPDKIKERELYISNTVGEEQEYKNKKIGILLEDMDNVTVDGNGSLFMFHGKMTTFAAMDCTNITFQDFDVDFQTPTVIDVTVESRDESDNSVTVYVPECYDYEIKGSGITWKSDVSPYDKKPYWTIDNCPVYTQRFDVKSGLTRRGDISAQQNQLFQNVQSIQDMGNHRLKFTYNSAPGAELTPGLCYQMRPTKRDHAGTFFWKSENVTLSNLDIFFLHGFGMVGQHSGDITLRDVDFEAPLESGRTTAGYADFIQMSGCKGKIDISGCTFSNPHDDPINVHGTFNTVTAVSGDNRTFTVEYMHNETAGFPNYFEGDQVEFVNMQTLLPVDGGTATVVKVDGPDGQGGNMGDGTDSLKKIKITLDKAVSNITANNFVVENITYTPEVHIHDNVFKETPTRGILVTTRKEVVIENNTFDGMGMSGIFISDDGHQWYESGRTENVTIRNNVFTRGKDHAIFIEPTNRKKDNRQTVHKNLTITGNKFYMENQYVLNAKSVTNLKFEDNEIYRQNPNVTFAIEPGNTSLNPGDSTKMSAVPSSETLSKRLYKFVDCKQVSVKGNKYDGGVNAGIDLSDTSDNDVTVEQDIAKKNADANTDKGYVHYESGDPNIIRASSDGTIVAVGTGTATVTPYLVVGGRKFPGQSVAYTVADDGQTVFPTGITLRGPEESKTTGEDVSYTAEVTGADEADKTVYWSVVDPTTGEATTLAQIDDKGTLTPKKSGAVEVVARTRNGLEARKILSIQIGTLSVDETAFEVRNPDSSSGKIVASGINQLTIYPSRNTGLWATNNNFKNLVLDNTNLTGNECEVTVKMSGLTKTGYEEAGLIFFKDNANYTTIQRKHNNGNASLNVVNEVNGNPTELSETERPVVSEDPIWFKLKKTGNQITGSYSSNGADWTDVSTVENNSFSQGVRAGLITASSGDVTPQASFTFSEFRPGDRTPSLTKTTPVDMLPSVTNADIATEQEGTRLKATCVKSEGTEVLIKWEAADDKAGAYSVIPGASGEQLNVSKDLKGKYVRAVFVPLDVSGISGEVVTAEAVEITGEGAEVDAETIKSSDAALSEAVITGLTQPFEEWTPSTPHYLTTCETSERTIQTSFLARDAKASVKVKFNGTEVPQAAELTLKNARNLIEVQVTAEDQITVNEYRFTVLRKGDNSGRLVSLRVNGEEIPLTDGIYDYSYSFGKSETAFIEAAAESAYAKTDITQRGKIVENGRVEVQKGKNVVTIMVTPETGAKPTVYTLTLRAPKADNANLDALLFSDNVQIEQQFTSEETEYTGLADESNTTIRGIAEEKDALVEVFADTEKIAEGVGSIYTAHSLKEGGNEVAVKVTSPDGTQTRTYTARLRGEGQTYLSDMMWESQTSGDNGNPTRRDKSCGNNTITLWNGTQNQTFEKGIGSHADSTIIYRIGGKGYTTFETYVGIDREIVNKQEPSITFEIYVDGQLVKSSDVMIADTPMQKLSVDVTGADELKLVMKKGEQNWSDHGDWADARLTKPFETTETVTIQIVTGNPAMGTATVDAEDGIYPKNAIATLTATPDEGYEFVNWTDTDNQVASTEQVYRHVTDSDATLTANFREKENPDGEKPDGGDKPNPDGEKPDGGDKPNPDGEQPNGGDKPNPDGEKPSGNKPNESESPSDTDGTVQTGDNMNLLLPIAGLALAVVFIGGAIYYRQRQIRKSGSRRKHHKRRSTK